MQIPRAIAYVSLAVLLSSFVSVQTKDACAASKGDPVHGKQVFEKQTCVVCHPGGGNTMAKDHMLKGAEFAKKYPDDAMIAKVIRSGVPKTPMPSFSKERLSDADLQDVIAYIRSLTPKK